MENYNKLKEEFKSKNFSQIAAKTIVDAAEDIGKNIKKEDLKSSQLRKFYDSVKQIEQKLIEKKETDKLEDKIIAQLVFLKPHLENAQKKGKIPQNFKNIIQTSIDRVVEKGTKEDFKYFVKFFEAIVAYHN